MLILFLPQKMSNVTENFQLFASLLTASVALFNYPEIDPNQRVINVPNSELQQSYDFIIVGGGSAGNVLANRLTEVENNSVLLLEAGGDETIISDTPILNYNLWFSDADWNYTTVAQSNACQATNGICTWPRGHILGGSSTLNDFVYVRGNRLDYDNWSEMGNTGWSYSDALPYFFKSEDNRDPSVSGSPYHMQGGYLGVNRSPYLTPLAASYVSAGGELGYSNVDVNGPTQTGFMISQGTIRNGSRCSTGRGFMRPIRNRTNLNVALRAFVTQIVLESKTAKGVTFIRNGQTITVGARKEVILSAGALNSPKILMLSGIGPQEHLEQLGINVVQNLRVGDNLVDHVGVPLTFSTKANVTINWQTSYQNVSAILDFAQNGRGPLTTLLGVECTAFINIPNQPLVQGLPDSEILFSSYIPSNQNSQLFAAVPFYLHPQSRGTVRLASTDPTVQPLIDPRYLTEQNDIEAALHNIQVILQLSQTQSLQQYGTQFYFAGYPLCSNYTDQNFFMCVLKQYSVTIYHPVGTCKMGPQSDSTAVVDSRLRVYGINNLRVIDASVMPTITTGNTNAPTIMIAERAADLIKQDHGFPITPPPTPQQ